MLYHRKFGKRGNALIWSVGHRWKELLDTNFSLDWPLGGFSLNIAISVKKCCTVLSVFLKVFLFPFTKIHGPNDQFQKIFLT